MRMNGALLRAVLLLSSFLPVTALAQTGPQPKAGEVRAIVPTGRVYRGPAEEKTLQKLDPLYWQDLVSTERGGRVRIGLTDGSVLNVGSSSQLQILEHDAQGQRTALQLAYGRLRAKAVKLSKPGANFTLRTPVGVAGVVGTRFAVRILDVFTEFFCVEGEVSVRNAVESVPGEVRLRAGEFTRVARGMPPTAPAPATAELLREVEEETDLPAAEALDRVELSWPPAACGDGTHLTLRAWSIPAPKEGAPAVPVEVDSELLTGTLRIGVQVLWVEGGRAYLPGVSAPPAPEGAFTPARAAASIPVKIWSPFSLVAGEGYRAPRAVFAGSAFYVLGPMGAAGRPEFLFGQRPAQLLWQGPCGAGFLAPSPGGRAEDVTLRLNGEDVARGRMNLLDVAYRVPQPPVVTKRMETRFGVDIHGLEGLDAAISGRPVLNVVLTNQTPAVIGNLKSLSPGGTASDAVIRFAVGAANISGGVARLEGSARGRTAGSFRLDVDLKLDPELELPKTPLIRIPAATGR